MADTNKRKEYQPQLDELTKGFTVDVLTILSCGRSSQEIVNAIGDKARILQKELQDVVVEFLSNE